MKARVNEAIAYRAAKKEYAKDAESHANHVAQSMAALMAYYMYSRCGCTKKTCCKRIMDIADMLSAPAVFGKDIHDADYIEWCRKELDLDVEEIIKLRVSIDYV